MSTFRRIDSLLDGKTSDQLASEVAARARERAEKDQRSSHRPPSAPVDLRPLVVRTSSSVTEGIYGLVLALSVIAVSWYSGPPDAGRVGLSYWSPPLSSGWHTSTRPCSAETCRRNEG
jgi:hypothetical protein